MASLNKVCLIGNLGRDPETRYMPNGEAVTNCTIATTETWKDKTTGEKKEATEWHRIVFFRKLAEIAGQYLKKGSQVYIEGSLKTRKWTDKEGAEKYTTEVIADTMQMLGSRHGSGQADEPTSERPAPSASKTPAKSLADGGSGFGDFEDDIPFASCAVEDDVIIRRLAHRSRRMA